MLLASLRTRSGADSRRIFGRFPTASVFVPAVVCLLLAGCGLTDGGSNYTPAGGWHDVTPPVTGTIADYAVSPDVPGLIVACIGAPGHVSADPPGPAALWRTRDGGATWRQLDISGYIAGCRLALPAGGHGLLFALNVLSASPYIQVSPDAGDTWQTLHLAYSDEDGGIQAEFAQLAASVVRDVKLYAPGVATSQGDNAASMSTFSVSADDGQSWKPVEAAPDPLLRQGYTVQAIAADYRSPGAWFRLIAPSYGAGSGPARLERSGDGGLTWTLGGTLGPAGSFYGQQSATLVTSPAQPSRLCAGLEPEMQSAQPDTSPSPEANILNNAHGGLLAGPPYLPPRAVALSGSDDGGLHWSGAVVAGTSGDNGRMVQPGAAMDAHGDCYLASTTSQFGYANADKDAASIWRLAPGAGAPELLAHLVRQVMGRFAVTPAGGGRDARFVAVALVFAPGDTQDQSCGPGCVSENVGPDTPHLVWASAP